MKRLESGDLLFLMASSTIEMYNTSHLSGSTLSFLILENFFNYYVALAGRMYLTSSSKISLRHFAFVSMAATLCGILYC